MTALKTSGGPVVTQAKATVRMMTEGGRHSVPADTNMGNLYRPFAKSGGGEAGGSRVATLETLYDFWINNVPDPDTALQQSPNFDEQLRQQPDVHACMRLRELTVASMPAHIEPSTDKRADPAMAKQVAEYVEDVFNRLPNRTDLYRQMQNAVLMGGQGIEFVWATINGVDIPVNYFPIHKTRFVFDRLGNMSILTRNTPVWGSYVQSAPTTFPSGEKAWMAPKGKFLYHKYMSEGGPWHRPAAEGYVYWGRGEDTNLYLPVTFDQFVMRFRLKWLERFGMPLTLMYYPTTDESARSRLVEIANAVRNETVVSLPRNVGEDKNSLYELEFIQQDATGNDAFANFSDTYTKPRIEKILLGGANLLETGENGSYGATIAQRDAGAAIIFRYDANNLDETLNQQLVPHIVWARWPGLPMELMPKHTMEDEEGMDQAQKLANLRSTAEMVPVDKQVIYDAAGVQRPDDKAKNEDLVFLGGSVTDVGSADNFPMPAPPNIPAGHKQPRTAPNTGGAK